MSVSFNTIYKKFLRDIDDYEFGLLEEDEMNEILQGYLEFAISEFTQCEKDLENIVEIDEKLYFEEDLTFKEQEILALCMRKSWLNQKLYSADLMVKSIGDRDHNAVQGTPYINTLSKLDEKIQDEIRTYSVEYTYTDFSLEDW